jgi:hypothetical protein
MLPPSPLSIGRVKKKNRIGNGMFQVLVLILVGSVWRLGGLGSSYM